MAETLEEALAAALTPEQRAREEQKHALRNTIMALKLRLTVAEQELAALTAQDSHA